MHKKHGFALGYSLVIGLLCVIICLSLLSMEILRSENIDNYNNYILHTEINKNNTNKLFKLLYNYINANVGVVGKINIRNYFIKETDFKIIYEGYFIKYDKNNDYFYTGLVYNNQITDYYNYLVQSSDIIFQKVNKENE